MLVATGGKVRADQPYYLTAESLMQEINRRGAKVVVAEMYDYRNPTPWHETMKHIESGDRDWLLASLALLPGTDAATTEDLYLSVDRALIRNAAAVLELYLERSPTPPLCRGVGEVAHSTFESAMSELKAKIAGVEAVSDPSLLPLRDTCLRRLRESEQGLRTIYGRPIQ